jgi:hypothetical protein
LANDFDKNRQQPGQQQGDPSNRADNLDEKLKRKDNEGVRPQDQGANRPDREGSENIERKRSA